MHAQMTFKLPKDDDDDHVAGHDVHDMHMPPGPAGSDSASDGATGKDLSTHNLKAGASMAGEAGALQDPLERA